MALDVYFMIGNKYLSGYLQHAQDMFSYFPGPEAYRRQPLSCLRGATETCYPWVCERTQLTISGATHRPRLARNLPAISENNHAWVSIEWQYCAAIACSASVSSFARRTPGSSSAAACSKAGAIILHGPHHGAQKSTTTGISFLPMCLEKLSARNSSGRAVNKLPLHFPQHGTSFIRSAGIRLTAAQWGQTICRESLKPFSPASWLVTRNQPGHNPAIRLHTWFGCGDDPGNFKGPCDQCALVFDCITPAATIYRYQATLPGVKLLVLRNHPLVEAALAEGLAARLPGYTLLPELDNVGHCIPLTVFPAQAACL